MASPLMKTVTTAAILMFLAAAATPALAQAAKGREPVKLTTVE